MSATPIGSKSATLRVMTVSSCTAAVAAIRACRSGRGSGTCSRTARWATGTSIETYPAVEHCEQVVLQPCGQTLRLLHVPTTEAGKGNRQLDLEHTPARRDP